MDAVQLTDNQLRLLAAWHETKREAEAANSAISKYAAQFASVFTTNAAVAERVREAFFPEPGEGTTRVQLPMGYELKCELKYSRKVDAEALESVREPLKEKGASLDLLIRRKPELETKAYRQLTEEQKAVFNQVLTTTPGTPYIELVPPKAKAL